MKKTATLKNPVKRLSNAVMFRCHSYALLVQKAEGRGFDGHYKDVDGSWIVCCHAASTARAETAVIAWASAALRERERFIRGKGASAMDEEE